MRARATDEAKAALGYLMGDLRTNVSTYRLLHYSTSGQEATIKRRDGKQFIVRVLEVIS